MKVLNLHIRVVPLSTYTIAGTSSIGSIKSGSKVSAQILQAAALMNDDALAVKKDLMLIKPSDKEVRRNYKVHKWSSQIGSISDFISTGMTLGDDDEIHSATHFRQAVQGVVHPTFELEMEWTIVFKNKKSV